MDPLRIVDVYEAFLEAGESIRFRLEQHGRIGDLQLHVFPSTPGQIHTPVEEHAIATPDELGVEWLDFLAADSGWHPLVVARKSGHSLGSPLEYSLTWAPVASDVAEPEAGPRTLAFLAPAPNPTPGRSRLGFELPYPDRVRIDVFDVRGRRVKTVVDRNFPAGRHHREWSGRDQAGHEVAAGVYYARLSVGDQILTRRLTVMH